MKTPIIVTVDDGIEDSDAVHMLTFYSRTLRESDGAIISTKAGDLYVDNRQTKTIGLAPGDWEVTGFMAANIHGERLAFTVGATEDTLWNRIKLSATLPQPTPEGMVKIAVSDWLSNNANMIPEIDGGAPGDGSVGGIDGGTP